MKRTHLILLALPRFSDFGGHSEFSDTVLSFQVVETLVSGGEKAHAHMTEDLIQKCGLPLR